MSNLDVTSIQRVKFCVANLGVTSIQRVKFCLVNLGVTSIQRVKFCLANLGVTSIQKVKFCLAYFSFDEFFISTNSVDPDGIGNCVAFHLGLHCLPKF